MDMNKTFMLRKEDRDPKWHVIDASDQVLGRMSTQIAGLLRGRGKADYTPHTDNGDYVVVINCDKVKLTGNKWKEKMYVTFSGWRGGRKEMSAEELLKRDPLRFYKNAVKGMLPNNRLSDQMIRRLRVYRDDKHPHRQAQ